MKSFFFIIIDYFLELKLYKFLRIIINFIKISYFKFFRLKINLKLLTSKLII